MQKLRKMGILVGLNLDFIPSSFFNPPQSPLANGGSIEKNYKWGKDFVPSFEKGGAGWI